MADELRKGVTIGAGNAEKAAAQNETVVETSEEETKEIIRANEDDFIQGLIAAAGFATEERQRIEIIREGRLYFAFEIRPSALRNTTNAARSTRSMYATSSWG